ncbi:gamma-glutamyltransferase family protein [Teredinibacter turnerae]|uniref:gamma-glutamyltransferase family protein n=1 Tax=Teredinibacter turnerae TaxID=2426 RepID=UPI00037B0543|nr:gamma-glutamyltransferase [Teredinibacter turnerae]
MTDYAFTAPHAVAADVGYNMLANGANAVDAMIAAAAAITVAYPHMNSIGGDSFWLISPPGASPIAIDGAGVCLQSLSSETFSGKLPSRGAGACITLPGTVAAWQCAREAVARVSSRAPRELHALLKPAVSLASEGVTVTESLKAACAKLAGELLPSERTSDTYGELDRLFLHPVLTQRVQTICNPALAATFSQLADAGLDDFYRGDLAKTICRDAQALGISIVADDFSGFAANECQVLNTALRSAQLYNLPAPTQGVASLMILALYDRLCTPDLSEEESVHLLVEATKLAFRYRDAVVADPKVAAGAEAKLLASEFLDDLARGIKETAAPWPHPGNPGDTVWMGCVDADGVMVSFIQSIYWEFGSGVVLPGSGIVWNNRGCSFSLDATHPNVLAPGKKPFHTLNPAYAEFSDGRRMVYGTMGGEGQPQTQAALFSRYAYGGEPLVKAIADDRWLLGRTWGESSTDLKIEPELGARIASSLTSRGHKVNVLSAKSESMGHAGAIVLQSDEQGSALAATDPRSDGAAYSSSTIVD